MTNIQLFLSTVSAEFRSYRDALRRDLDRPNVTVKVQEDFIPTGSETLDKLDDYIKECHAVIHLVGDMTGALTKPTSVAAIGQRWPDLVTRLPILAPYMTPDAAALSYTQWEAWLALYHDKMLLIAVPEDDAPRDERYQLVESQRAAQQEHLARLASIGRYAEIRFASADRLAVSVLRSKIQEILAQAGPMRMPINLPYISIGELFTGREALLQELERDLGPVPETAAAPIVIRALTGMGGVGKTRLAVEHAWRHSQEYVALLFVGASSPEALGRSIAALCASQALDLPAQRAADENRQRDAVLEWLVQHPGWLLILDSVDTEDSARAVERLLPQLLGGHVLLTSTLMNWGRGVATLQLDVLAPEAAAGFLLASTDARRRKQSDDASLALAVAEELGGLPLALEQAGAYMEQRRLNFAQYLAEWQSQRQNLLTWFDPRSTTYTTSLAVTWQTSFSQIGAASRLLLQRISWLATEPIPEALISISSPELEPVGPDPMGALAELESYSLIARASNFPRFSVHRLVQEVTRHGQSDEAARDTLTAALRWVNAAFVGDPDDVRDWPVLEPLVPHVRALVARADGSGIAHPSARLMNQVGVLLSKKALYADAESLLRRALAINEVSFGSRNPAVASSLLNLAQLLQETNRLAEAEALVRHALGINEACFGPIGPEVAVALNNLALLLKDMNRGDEAESLIRRALAIDEGSFGTHDRKVATDLNNLALVLQAIGRLTKAEPLMLRALSIDEEALGADHPDVARDLNNLGQLFMATNRVAEAEPLIRRALRIDEANFGVDHPVVARDLNNLAMLVRVNGRVAEGELLMRRALAIDEAHFKKNHPIVVNDHKNLARLQDIGPAIQ